MGRRRNGIGGDIENLSMQLGDITGASNRELTAKLTRQHDMEAVHFPKIQQQVDVFAGKMRAAEMPVDRVWADHTRNVTTNGILGSRTRSERIRASLPMWLISRGKNLTKEAFPKPSERKASEYETAVAVTLGGRIIIVDYDTKKPGPGDSHTVTSHMKNGYPAANLKTLFGEYLETDTPLDKIAAGVGELLVASAIHYADLNRQTDIRIDRRYGSFALFDDTALDLSGWKLAK